MKNLIITFIIIIIHTVVHSQVGIYKTYEDFQNGKMIEYKGILSTQHVLGNFKVKFKDKSDQIVEVKVDKKSMWGYARAEGEILRLNKKSEPYLIVIAGKLVVYGNYTTKFNSNGDAVMKQGKFSAQVSEGLNGEMFDFRKKYLKKILKEDSAALLKLKKVKDNYVDLSNFVIEYNGG